MDNQTLNFFSVPKIQQNLASPVNATVTPSSDFKTADFTPASTIKSDDSGSYTFYAVSPSTAFTSFSTKYKDWTVSVNAVQTPTAASVDESVQLLAATSSTTTEFPSSVGFSFSHITAYGLISLTNFTPAAGETVSSITLKASVPWVGTWYWYPADYETHTAGEWATTATSTNQITINTSSYTDVWFACVPVDLGGKDVDVVVSTNQGTYSKTITIPAGKKFEAGKIAKFGINMSGVPKVAPVVFTKVTDLDKLTVGSEVIIVADEADYAVGAQSSNIRSAVAITKTDDTILSPSSDVKVFTLGRGVGSNFYSFVESTNYLAAPGGGNYVGESATLDAASTWKIGISGGVTTMTSTNPSATQVNLKYNYNSGNPRFTCYVSGMENIAIYKLNDSGEDDNIITYIDIPATKSATVGTPVALGATTNSSASISYSSSNPTVATVDASGTVTPIAAGNCEITASVSSSGSYQSVSAVCEITVSAPETWVEVALSDLTSSDVFVIVGENDSSHATYAIANDGGTSSDPSCVAVTISGTNISGTVEDKIKWKVTGNSTDGYTFLLYNDTSKWLYCNTTADSKSNNNLRVGTGARKVFLLNSDNRLVTNDTGTTYVSRYICFNNTSNFRGYINTSTGPCTFKFYKKL